MPCGRIVENLFCARQSSAACSTSFVCFSCVSYKYVYAAGTCVSAMRNEMNCEYGKAIIYRSMIVCNTHTHTPAKEVKIDALCIYCICFNFCFYCQEFRY